VTPQGLAEIATYADGVGPHHALVIPRDSTGHLLEPTDMVDDAHARGLFVHAFTMRDENKFLPADFRVGTDPKALGDAIGEAQRFFDAGVDGIFTDFPDTGVFAREDWLSRAMTRVS
jgi:glycerophosphoryl diester phosphodiesterase